MAIYRGAGGAGDATGDSASEALLVRELAVEAQADADAASAFATAAASSASSASTSATNAAASAASLDTTSFVRKTNNLSDLSSASTARTNLGVTATGSDTTYASRASNLSDLSSASTARTNLGLGTIATQAASAVAITGGSVTGITDLTVSDGGTGASTFTANSVLLGNGTSSFQTVAPSTTGNILTSNGTIWVSQAPASSGGFDAGTRMMFAQTSAPTGWTKDTTNYNNHAIRVVTGTASTGGSVDFTTAFTSGLSAGATTLSTAQIPSHTHAIYDGNGFGAFFGATGLSSPGSTFSTAAEGGGGSHTHTIPSFAVKYLDVITATKN